MTAGLSISSSPVVGGTARSRGAWAIYLGMIVVTLDGSALNLALPTIGSDLGATASGLEWVVNAYTLPLASLLLVAGTIGDRTGARTLFVASAGGFGLASVACALAPTLPLLITFRAIQGVFAAGLLPMVLALVVKTITDPAEQAKAVNLVAVSGGIAIAAGPLLGGLLTDSIGWRAAFWLTVAPIAAAVLLILRTPETSRGERRRIDLPGQLAGTLALTALIAGMVEAASVGWTAPIVLALLASGVIGIAVFIRIEHRASEPMVPLGLFRNRAFSAASLGGFAFQFSAYGLQFVLALYLQQRWDLTALQAGLVLIPFSLGSILAAVGLNPRLLHRGPRFMLLAGTPLVIVGALITLGTADTGTWRWLIVGNALVGIGTGIYSPSLNQVATASAGTARAGLASGVYNTSRQIGQATGIALLGSLIALPDSTSGVRVGLAICALLGALILVLTVVYAPRAQNTTKPSSPVSCEP
ncbi:MFS transporter [Leifsonia sp. AG29]|uniref:MFS transporter n=1 Tax=Leifsonia sp. AG29 TaxID=2598860 RepID=UPI00131BD6AA|nr:MFS transporter [Leifsonia sp. AG29]